MEIKNIICTNLECLNSDRIIQWGNNKSSAPMQRYKCNHCGHVFTLMSYDSYRKKIEDSKNQIIKLEADIEKLDIKKLSKINQINKINNTIEDLSGVYSKIYEVID